MKRAPKQPPIALVPPSVPNAPFVDAAFATRLATIEVRSGLGAPDRLNTSVKAIISTDTYHADPDSATVAMVIEIVRTLGGGDPQRERFDIAASELDVFVVAVTEAVRLARENGVIDQALAKCVEARDAEPISS